MAGRQTRGRQRIPIRQRENQDDLYATFSKRRLGLYKKAGELSTICGVDIGIIIFSPSNHPFSFFSPSMESVVGRYMNPNQPSAFERISENHTRSRIERLNRRLDEVQDKKDETKQREMYLDEIERTRQKGLWEQVPIESLNREQVNEWRAMFENIRSRATNRIEELKNGGSSSSVFQHQNAPNLTYAPVANTSTGASFFSHSNVPPGAIYAPASETIGAGQLPNQYFVPPSIQYPFGGRGGGGGGGIGHIPPQYHVSPPARDPFAAGSSTDRFSLQYNYFPPQVQNPSTGGGTGFYFPPQAQNPSTGGGTGYNYFPPQAQNPSTSGGTGYNYFPSQSQNPSTGGGTGGAGPSNINP